MRKVLLILLLALFLSISYADSMGPTIITPAMLWEAAFGLLQTTNFGPFSFWQFMLALIVTIILELLSSSVYIFLRKLSNAKDILITVILVNLISVPLLWYVMMPLHVLGLFDECAVVLLEFVLIFLTNKKRLKMTDAFAMSLINNIFSFLGSIAVLIFLVIILKNAMISF